MNTIGERLTDLLEVKGIKAPELAKKIGVSKGTIYNIINGKTLPKQDTLSNIAKELNTTIDYLIFGTREYKDTLEKQLLETFRQLNYDNKIEIVGETTKLLTKQKLEKSR
ncbi:helix-turn-helix domain-containing protein [Vallitalea guaymasensis]|uniref:helix-turn-helix domain-containing protein n=1 Tax=Vallitalea guaymasensis TaxID=1185412 RepID=UPI00187D4A92|nr:helix-turn-helix transcriptional regulator [Vallitalea guaymasensis]